MVETDRLRESLTLERWLVLQKDTCNSGSPCHRREKSAETHRMICCVSFGWASLRDASFSHRPVSSPKCDRSDHLLHECDGSTGLAGEACHVNCGVTSPFTCHSFSGEKEGMKDLSKHSKSTRSCVLYHGKEGELGWDARPARREERQAQWPWCSRTCF